MFREFLERNHIEDKNIAVGVSGGSDSLALILMAHDELTPLGYKLTALTVDHRLRPTSAQEAAYVSQIMKENGIEHHILVWDTEEKPSSGIEEAARKARYSMIAEWCEDNAVKFVMTAHHMYDQAETFFMRLFRGSGLNGLCGMREVFQLHGLYILRPLLNTNPEIMKDYLRKRNISWIKDESNDAEEYLRVKMRHALPEFYEKSGITAEQIINTMTKLQYSRDYLEHETRAIIDNSFKNWFNYAYCCLFKNFLAFDDELKFRLLSFLLRTVGQTEYAPRAEKIINLIDRLKKNGFHSATLGHCRLYVMDDCLWIYPEEFEIGNYNLANWKMFKQLNPKFRRIKLPFQVRAYLFNHFRELKNSPFPFNQHK